MIRIGKLTDYAIVLLVHFVRNPEKKIFNATELARETRVALPTTIKTLKMLTRGGVLGAHRGLRGGYSLVKAPKKTSVSEIIHAMEGPVALTTCCLEIHEPCDLRESCSVRKKWPKINGLVLTALKGVSLHDMACQ